MANNVIGLFDNEGVADQVVSDLVSSGFEERRINRFEGDHDDLEGELRREGIPADEASYYANGLSAGGALVSVRADESETDTAVEIMNRYADAGDANYDTLGGTDVDTRTDYDTTPAATGYAAGTLDTDLTADADANVADDVARPVTTDVTDRDRGVATGSTVSGDEARLEVVEEQLQIGKREVSRGGVRVRRYVTETPVEEQVTLRDETINVDRHRVDRAVDGTEGNLFSERTFEFTETDEEAVVAKEARVVEEVVVDKDVEERTETVRDTVRRTDVDIEQLSGGGSYRGSVDESDPSYMYGQTLASDARYSDREWNDIEADARRDWETQNQGGTWDSVRDSIRNSWERARGRS